MKSADLRSEVFPDWSPPRAPPQEAIADELQRPRMQEALPVIRQGPLPSDISRSPLTTPLIAKRSTGIDETFHFVRA